MSEYTKIFTISISIYTASAFTYIKINPYNYSHSRLLRQNLPLLKVLKHCFSFIFKEFLKRWTAPIHLPPSVIFTKHCFSFKEKTKIKDIDGTNSSPTPPLSNLPSLSPASGRFAKIGRILLKPSLYKIFHGYSMPHLDIILDC